MVKNKILNYFTKWEITLWCSSVALILISFFIFDGKNYLALIASLIGVTSLIFIAKGNPIGQCLMILFSLYYGAISFGFSYYGEMVTYLGMSAPMAVYALVTWLKHPYNGNKAEVQITVLKKRDVILISLSAAAVAVAFYFILSYFNNANLIPSTLSVATSFIAVSLSAKRSPYFALAYAVNDIVLIVLWVLAAMVDISYISVIVCFVVFLANDLYSFFNWIKMKKRQERGLIKRG